MEFFKLELHSPHHCIVKCQLQAVVLQQRAVASDSQGSHLTCNSQGPASKAANVAGKKSHDGQGGFSGRPGLVADTQGRAGADARTVTEDNRF